MPSQIVTVELVGRFQGTIWNADDRSVVIASVLDSNGDERIVKGPLDDGSQLAAGLVYRFHGRWRCHEKHGQRFEFAAYSPIVPHDKRGVLAYLTSLAEGITEKQAAKLWDAFGANAVQVLRTQPNRVAAAGIMTEQTAAQASQALQALHNEGTFQEVKIDLLRLFAGRGFQQSKLIKECLRLWGAAAAELIRKDPYRLMLKKLISCGFKRCDKLYLDLGLPPDRLKRQALCAWHAVRSDQAGHTWHAGRSVVSQLQTSINNADPIRALRLAIRARLLVKHKDEAGVWLAERRKANNEAIVADKIKKMLADGDQNGSLWPPPERCSGLTKHQQQQFTIALAAQVGILTGTPGTGKTYTTAALVAVLAEDFGINNVAVCAPTGKAAVRIAEAMIGAGVPLRATTIHALLEIGRKGHDGDGWNFKRNRNNPLDQLFVIVDEASMMDADIAASLLDAIGPGTRLLFVGDPYQLPPVGHGAPLRDMIAAGVPNGRLTEIQRNTGLIVRACAAIKDGKDFEVSERFDPKAGLNLRHIEAPSEESQIDALLAVLDKLGANGHEWDPLWDVQVLIATNNSGSLSRNPINRLLQTRMNALGAGRPEHPFRAGDKIICLRNHLMLDANNPGRDSHYIANGEIGEVINVMHPHRLTCRFTHPERSIFVPVGKKEGEENDGDGSEEGGGAGIPDFDLAYAITCHKSQGSEWPVVILMIDSSGGGRRVCSREWIYTAISRAAQLCITIGRLNIAQRMAKRVTLERRKTLLADLISGRATR